MAERRARRLAPAVLLAVLGVLLCVRPAAAEPADPYAALAAAGFEAVARGVTSLAGSGDPHARPAIEALLDRRLYAAPGGMLLIRVPSGWTDARTGEPVQSVPDALRPVRLNNRLRNAIDSALSLLDLRSPDAGTRRSAATALYLAHDPTALAAARPVLDHVSGLSASRHAVALARAASSLLVASTAADEQRRAIGVLRAEGGLPARAVLSTAVLPPALAAQAQDAVRAIDRRLQVWSAIQSLFYGVSLGSVLLVAALGLFVTFGVMGVINMAHGELMMLGAYVVFGVQRLLHAVLAPALADALALPLAVPAAFLVCGLVGIAIERTVIRFLYGRPLETLLATWGLSLLLQQAARSIFGASNVQVSTPGWLSGAVHLGGLEITLNRLAIFLFALACLGGLSLVFRRTRLGLEMRAVTQNRRMASLMGIRTPRVDALAFGLGAGFAGLAGVAVSQIDNVSPNLGQGYIIDSFMVVVFGGVGNLWGTFASALLLGVANKLLEPVAGAVLGKIVVLVLVVLFIQRRPRGLFPLKGRAVES